VIVHAITQKGRGYAPALNDEADQFHAVGVIDPVTGLSLSSSGGTSWTSVFADEILSVADDRPDVVGITAAMLIPVGLHLFAQRYPNRVFDVGIAEQHAVTSAAGMAHGGLHPVVAVYATFINRAFDQVLMDVALHREGVTFVLDRAGVTGNDGASHNGMWDLSLLALVPGIRIAAPRDAPRLRELLREAVDVSDGPTVLRFQKGSVAPETAALERIGNMDVLARQGEDDVLLIAVGAMVGLGLEVADRLTQQGIGITVVDPRWVLPVDEALIPLAARHQLVVVVEDNGVAGGVCTQVAAALRAAKVPTAVQGFGIPQEFLDHASRAQVFEQIGLTVQDVSREVVEHFARQEATLTALS
jgi:1-deoxy-D-xylulose-5-phosphate synthase